MIRIGSSDHALDDVFSFFRECEAGLRRWFRDCQRKHHGHDLWEATARDIEARSSAALSPDERAALGWCVAVFADLGEQVDKTTWLGGTRPAARTAFKSACAALRLRHRQSFSALSPAEVKQIPGVFQTHVYGIISRR